MKVSAKLYYGKSKTPGDRMAIRGAKNILSALNGMAILIQGTRMERASRIELVATEKARRSQ